MANSNPTDNALRRVLGPTLQEGAMRAILILAGFSAVGALVSWLIL